MQKLMRWAASQGNWARSDFGSLPAVQQQANPALQRWQVVAGGLALVLSRLSRTERSARFPASFRLYQGLRRRLRQGAAIDASSELISDVMHEVAGVADSLTTQCLRACFDASLRPGPPQGDDAPTEGRSTSRLQSQPRPANPSIRSTLVPAWRDTTPSEAELSERGLELAAA